MTGADLPESLDSTRLAQVLGALANPVRIDLLKALRVPRTVSEIKLRPRRGAGGRDRSMSRVAVQRHLAQLLAIGVVRSQPTIRNGRRANLYLVNHSQTFALTEELRRLALLRADEGIDGTQIGPAERRPRIGQASLTVVNGVREGWQVPLAPRERPWSVGRHPSCEVSLDYDPFVSLRHAQVVMHAHGCWLLDLPGSRNGTTLNWERVPKGVAQPLCTGDIVGVGRSILVFRAG